MKPRRLRSVRQASATIFALSALLPFLVLFYLLWRFNLVNQTEVQAGILLALLMAVLGFVVFLRMGQSISMLAQVVQTREPAAQAAPLAQNEVPGIGAMAEIRQLGETFASLLEDLRGSTERLEDLAFKLGTLNEMVEVAARVPKIQDLLGLVLERSMRTVKATIGSIMLLDRAGKTLQLAAAQGLPEEVVGLQVNLGEGIAGRVVQLGEVALVENIETDPRFARPNNPRYGSGSFICMPIRAGDRVIGVLNLSKKADGRLTARNTRSFTPTDLEFLNPLMTSVAYALDNARLLEEALQSAKRLQEAVDDLRATQAQLVRVETLRAVGDLAAGMAHHLNNLLTVILGRTQLLLGEVQDGGIRRYLQIIERAANDSVEVVRRVGRFTRTQPVSEPVPVDLNQLAEDVLELTRARWQNETELRGIRIEVSLEPGELPPVPGEPGPLREVLLNLVFNAVDALPKGGRITVRTWASAQRVHCSVADTGVGMSEEVRRRVFEPFFTTKGPKSTGLGLSLSYGIIQRHRGELNIDSGAGKGTTATISLPLGTAVASGPVRPAPSGPPLNILVIDDEPEVRETLAEMLVTEGHLVSQAAGGPEGLARLGAGAAVDLVLTDLGMPEMTGWQVAQAIKGRWPHLPVGLITGWGEELEAFAEERRSVDVVITKPVTREGLREAIAHVRPAP